MSFYGEIKQNTACLATAPAKIANNPSDTASVKTETGAGAVLGAGVGGMAFPVAGPLVGAAIGGALGLAHGIARKSGCFPSLK